MRAYTHPHPDPAHVVFWYRYSILDRKAKRNRQLVSSGQKPSRSAARGIIHYQRLVDEYRAAKALMLSRGSSTAHIREQFRSFLTAQRKKT